MSHLLCDCSALVRARINLKAKFVSYYYYYFIYFGGSLDATDAAEILCSTRSHLARYVGKPQGGSGVL